MRATLLVRSRKETIATVTTNKAILHHRSTNRCYISISTG
jgi:hypothetical protein